MRKYILEYLKFLEDKDNFTKQDVLILKDKINYFNHERLIHLLVTLFFGIFTLFFLVLGMISYIFLIAFAMCLIFLIFYIRHYFFLESAVHYLYKAYDKLIELEYYV